MMSAQQIKLTIFENEPMARLAEQRLSEDSIPSVVQPLGVGPGGWGVATYLPHAIYVNSADEMRARQVLDLQPAELTEREGPSACSRPRLSLVIMLIITAAALLSGTIELMARRLWG